MRLEPYLSSSVTLYLQKGVKKNLCHAGFLLRPVTALPPELLRDGDAPHCWLCPLLLPAAASRTKEHENKYMGCGGSMAGGFCFTYVHAGKV